jgi:zinc/manganese transport system substrate-binding protein
MRGPLFLSLLAAAAILVAGCGSGASGSSDDPDAIDVVVTTTQLGDIVRAIGGDAVDVHQILKPNTDPHDYEPRPRDIQETAGAKLVVTSGDNLDRWMGEVVDNAGGHPTVLDAGAGRPVALPGEDTGPEASRFDPHWWHDPRNVEYAVRRIAAALTKADPAATAQIRTGRVGYLGKLMTEDTAIATCIAAVPADQRKLVTDHDAFGYFAKRYDITVVGAVIPSQTTQAQPSAGDLAKLTGVIKREGVKAIFPESSINPKLAEAIARETGASADHTLYGDTLGPAGSKGDTYLRMEAANADAMVRGFTGGAQGCTIPGLLTE